MLLSHWPVGIVAGCERRAVHSDVRQRRRIDGVAAVHGRRPRRRHDRDQGDLLAERRRWQPRGRDVALMTGVGCPGTRARRGGDGRRVCAGARRSSRPCSRSRHAAEVARLGAQLRERRPPTRAPTGASTSDQVHVATEHREAHRWAPPCGARGRRTRRAPISEPADLYNELFTGFSPPANSRAG